MLIASEFRRQLPTVDPQLTVPLFPLQAVLFPGGPLRLRVFEPRYLDMVGRCLRENTHFGVALIVEGKEVGPARTASIGTTARIDDFERLSDGLLGIAARGCRRFKILAVATQSDGLNLADVELLPEEPDVSVSSEYALLAELLRKLFSQVSMLYEEVLPRLEDASWLGARLSELLPLDLSTRQRCLEMDDPLERLRFLDEIVRAASRSN